MNINEYRLSLKDWSLYNIQTIQVFSSMNSPGLAGRSLYHWSGRGKPFPLSAHLCSPFWFTSCIPIQNKSSLLSFGQSLVSNMKLSMLSMATSILAVASSRSTILFLRNIARQKQISWRSPTERLPPFSFTQKYIPPFSRLSLAAVLSESKALALPFLPFLALLASFLPCIISAVYFRSRTSPRPVRIANCCTSSSLKRPKGSIL